MLPVSGGSFGSPKSLDGSPDFRGHLERVFEEDDEDEMVCTPSSGCTPKNNKNADEIEVRFSLKPLQQQKQPAKQNEPVDPFQAFQTNSKAPQRKNQSTVSVSAKGFAALESGVEPTSKLEIGKLGIDSLIKGKEANAADEATGTQKKESAPRIVFDGLEAIPDQNSDTDLDSIS